MKFAQQTTVSVERSKAEIEQTLIKYGASSFMSGWDGERCMIGFEMHQKRIKFTLNLPDKADRCFTHREAGRSYKREVPRSDKDSFRLWDQACKQRWRALLLAVKAKMEAVECGIATFEEEFLPYFVIPGTKGQTVGSVLIPELNETYKTGKPLPKLLDFRA